MKEIVEILREKGVPEKHLAEAAEIVGNAMANRGYTQEQAISYVIGWVQLVES